MSPTHRPTLTSSTFEGVGFIRLAGEIDLVYAEELRQLGEGLITDYVGTVRIDLSAVTFMDSTALGALVSIRNKAVARNCVVIIEKPAPRVLRVLQLSGLDAVFTIEKD
jgi:anti-sigma B factor antagonist